MIVLTKAQKSALVGMILGDGFLQKTGKKNARLRLEHSLKQKEYLEWKVSLLPKLFQGKVKILERKHPKTGRIYKYVRVQSNSSPFLGKMRELFYPKGKKIIPPKAKSLLKHPLGLAIWYLDDGYYYKRDNVGYLYLGKISKKEANIALGLLESNFGIKTKVLDKKNKGLALYFSPNQTERLKKTIQRFVIPSMIYKLPS